MEASRNNNTSIHSFNNQHTIPLYQSARIDSIASGQSCVTLKKKPKPLPVVADTNKVTHRSQTVPRKKQGVEKPGELKQLFDMYYCD